MTTEHKNVAIEKAMGDTRVIWTPNKDWGDQAFLVGGTMYRRARARETPHVLLATRDGEIKLRKMSRWERETVHTPVIDRELLKKKRKAKVKRKLV